MKHISSGFCVGRGRGGRTDPGGGTEAEADIEAEAEDGRIGVLPLR